MSKKVVKIKRSTNLLGRDLPGQGLVAAGLLLTPLAQSMAKNGQGTFDLSSFNPLAAEGASEAFAQQLDNLLLGGSQGLELTEVDDLSVQHAVPFDESLLEALAQGELPAATQAAQRLDPDLVANSVQLSDVTSAGGEVAGTASSGETWVVAQAETTAAGAGTGGAAGSTAAAGGAATGAGAAAGVAALSPALVAGLAVGAGLIVASSGSSDADTTAPEAPSLALKNDSGTDASDGITNSGDLVVSGQETGATVEYSTDGGQTWSASFTPLEGANSVQVRQTDAAGNVSQASQAFTFTLDTSVSNVTAGLSAASDTGTLGDNATTNRSPTFEGTAEPGSAIKLTIGAREFSTTADVDGAWSVSVPTDAPLAAGVYTPVLQVTDLAGNVATSTGSLSVELTKSLLVVDGPLAGAKVYYDTNLNGVADDGEFLGQTNDKGGIDVNYVPVAGAKFIIVPDDDTTDVFTGNKFTTPLQLLDSGEEGQEVVSPLTTLVAGGASEAALKTALGIPADVSLSKFNFVDKLQNGSADEKAAAQKVAAATVVAGNVVESTLKAIQAQKGALSDGASQQQDAAKVAETVGKVLAALPTGTSLADATKVATQVAMVSKLDTSGSAELTADALVSKITQAISSGGNAAAALTAVSDTIANSTAAGGLKTLATATSEALATVSTKVGDLFDEVAQGTKTLEAVVGLGGEFDKLEDEAEDDVSGDVNTYVGVTLVKGGLFDATGNGFQQGGDVDFLEDDEYFVEGTSLTVKGNVFEGASGNFSGGVNTVGIGALQSVVPDYVRGTASPDTFTISTSDFDAATVDAKALLAAMGFPGAVPLTGSWQGGAYNFSATAGSAIVKEYTVQAGDKLTFAYEWGSYDYLPWNDYGFIAIKKQGGASADDGIRELVDVRDLKGPQLFKDAGIWKVNSNGQYEFTFTEAGTYTIGIGATDVGDKIFDTILTVQNLTVSRGGTEVAANAAADQTLGNVSASGEAPIIDVSAYVQTGKFGTLVITKTGDFLYQPGGANADDVPPGALLEDAFTYTVKLPNGLLASQKVVFTVMGEPEAELAASSDTGVVGDGITFDSTPLLTGDAAVGSKVTVTVNDKTYGPITVDATGKWEVQLDELADGTYGSSVTIENKGATATADGPTITIDTQAPKFLSATTSTDGSQIELTYGLPLDEGAVPASAFTVTVGDLGAQAAVTAVEVVGNKVLLTLADPIGGGLAVKVSYTDPSVGDDVVALQDLAGNDAPSLVDRAVSNAVQDDVDPAAPEIIELTDDVGTIGLVDLNGGGKVTNDARPTLKITAETGSKVEVFNGAQLLGQATEVEAGQFEFTPAQALSDGVISLTAKATDLAGNGSALSAAFEFTLDLAGPVFTSEPYAAIDENVAADSVVYEAQAADALQGSGVTYSLGGKDAAALAINPLTGAVTIKASPDFETKAAYDFTVTATDTAGNSTVQAVTVGVNDLDEIAPTATITLSDSALKSGETATVKITFSEAIAAASFTADDLVADNGVVSGLTQDSTNPLVFTATFTPNVDVEDTSNVVTLADKSYTDVAGNQGAGAVSSNYVIDTLAPAVPTITAQTVPPLPPTVIGTATLKDGETLTVTVNGATYNNVSVVNGQWSVDTATAQPDVGSLGDFVIGQRYEVTATVTDAAGNVSTDASTQELYVFPDAPLFANGTVAAVQVVEGQAALYTAFATDASSAVTYSLDGADKDLLNIDQQTGTVTLKSGALDVDDASAKTSYSFTVTATDSDQNASVQTVTVNVVNDVGDDVPADTTGPVFSQGSTASASVVGGQNALFATLATDASGTVTYSLEGPDAAALQISPSGVVTLLSGDLDASAQGSYAFTVVASDGNGNSSSQQVNVSVAADQGAVATTQVVDSLSPAGTEEVPREFDASTDTFSIQDDLSLGNVTRITGFGADDTLSFIGSGDTTYQNTGADVEIVTNVNGVVSKLILSNVITDVENTFVFDVDSFNALDIGNVIIAGADSVAPTFANGSSATASILENQSVLYTALATDASGTVTYSLTGADAGKLAIDASGRVTLKTGVLDVDAQGAQSSYSFNVVASDGTNEATQAVTVNVLDDTTDNPVADTTAPLFASGADVTATVIENQPSLYTALATDAVGPVTYTLGGVDASKLVISPAGVVTLAAGGAVDVDAEGAPTSYTFTVTATDAEQNASTQTVTVNVLNDPSDDGPSDTTSPTFTSATAVMVNEGQGQLYVAQATDAENPNLVYTLKAGGDADQLDIDAATGQVTLKAAALGDHETKSSYSFTVMADDGVTTPAEQQVTVTLNDLDETDGLAQFVGSTFDTAGFTGLGDEGLPLADGTDVLVSGTAFLGGSGAPNVMAAAALFGDADVTVKLGQGQIDAGVLNRTDAAFDQLINDLHAAGMDTLSIDSAGGVALAQADFTFDAGTDVLVNGTAFLGGAGSPNLMAAAALFGDADVTVELSQADVVSMVASADEGFDAQIEALQAAGMDTLSLTAAQAADLAAGGLTFDAGTDVMVTGTAFISGGSSLSINSALAGASALFADADVTVSLSTADGQMLLSQTDAQFDQLIDDLQAAGMDMLSIDAGQAAALALSDSNFTFDAGTDVLVHGTAFLGAPAQELATLFNKDGIGGDTHVAVTMSDGDFARYLEGGADNQSVTELLTALQDAGVDHLALDPSQLLAASAAGMALDGAAATLADQLIRLTEQDVSLADFQGADFADLAEVISGMDAVLNVAANSEVPTLVMDDELANALAEAGIDTSKVEGVSVEVVASADLQTPDGGLAFLASSAQDMVQAGVDKVVLTSGTDVAFALRDADESGADLGFTLDDLPAFDKTANPDGYIGLVVDQDDLAALVSSLGQDATEADAISALAAKGFTDVGLVGVVQLGPDAQDAAATAGVEFVDASTLATELQISEQDLVKLLGGGSDTTDPFDPFHKP